MRERETIMAVYFYICGSNQWKGKKTSIDRSQLAGLHFCNAIQAPLRFLDSINIKSVNRPWKWISERRECKMHVLHAHILKWIGTAQCPTSFPHLRFLHPSLHRFPHWYGQFCHLCPSVGTGFLSASSLAPGHSVKRKTTNRSQPCAYQYVMYTAGELLLLPTGLHRSSRVLPQAQNYSEIFLLVPNSLQANTLSILHQNCGWSQVKFPSRLWSFSVRKIPVSTNTLLGTCNCPEEAFMRPLVFYPPTNHSCHHSQFFRVWSP